MTYSRVEMKVGGEIRKRNKPDGVAFSLSWNRTGQGSGKIDTIKELEYEARFPLLFLSEHPLLDSCHSDPFLSCLKESWGRVFDSSLVVAVF